MSATSLRLRRLSADGEMTVVSERRHRKALEDAARLGVLTATLQPTARAIAVYVSTQVGQVQIGRLPDEHDAEYRPTLDWLWRNGSAGFCQVDVTRMPTGPRARLRLGPPESVLIENDSTGLVMLEPEATVTVTDEEHHQRQLARYRPQGHERRRVAVELGWCTIRSGKYRGQRAVEVRLDGGRVGQLTYLMSQRYGPPVDRVTAASGRPGCEALVFHGKRGVELELRLPREHATPVPPPASTPAIVQAEATPEPAPAKHASRRPLVIAAAVVGIALFAANVDRDSDDVPPTDDGPAVVTTTTEAVETTKPSRKAKKPAVTTTTRRPATKRPKPTTTVQPAPEPEPAPANDCDPNYSGCVPIASDVDCAGGSGNGPAYVSGPITVIGTDIYDLDGNGDGEACEG